MAVATKEMPISPIGRHKAADLAELIRAVRASRASCGREFRDMRNPARTHIRHNPPIENDHDSGEWQDWPADETDPGIQ